MSIGLVGRKCGMTRVYTEAGVSIPVTVVEVLANRVTQVKGEAVDGYRAVQVTYGKRRPQLLSKAAAGHYAKANVEPGKSMVEFRLTEQEGTDLAVGWAVFVIANFFLGEGCAECPVLRVYGGQECRFSFESTAEPVR